MSKTTNDPIGDFIRYWANETPIRDRRTGTRTQKLTIAETPAQTAAKFINTFGRRHATRAAKERSASLEVIAAIKLQLKSTRASKKGA